MSKKTRAVAHNALLNFTNKFTVPFAVEKKFIDCREFSGNFPNGLIPLVALADIVDSVMGTWEGRINQYPGLIDLTPRFESVPVANVYSHPSFNRDTSPNHCAKLEADWYNQFAMPSLGLKMPAVYGGQVLNADSTHTSTNRIRMGMTELPFWLADVPDQGTFEETFKLALLMAGHLFLAINVRNKRAVDIFDQHFIRVATGIYPAPQIDEIVNRVKGVAIKRCGVKIPYAVHNLNETYGTYELDKDGAKPGRLLEISLKWHARNFKNQSIDGCLLSSFAMFVQDCEEANITVTEQMQDQLASELIKRYNTANSAQLAIKHACLLNDKSRPGYTALDSNYMVCNGLKHIAGQLKLATARDGLRQWAEGF